ncbi:MAG: hypothetical protein ACI3VN_03325 [Candidatus Onthomonas sp.]
MGKGKQRLTLLLVLCLFLLTGCSSLLEREYRSVSRHISQTADTEDTSVLRVERYSDLVNSVQFFVTLGEEEGVVHLYQYSGDVEQDLEEACQEVLTQDPLGAWALLDIDWSCSRIVSYYECTFTFSYRHTVDEMAAIRTAVGTTAIRETMEQSLTSYAPTLVLKTSRFYAQKELLFSLLQEAYYANPAYALGYPSVSVSVYPQEGQSAQQIVELSFSYGQSQSALQSQAEEAAAAAATLLGPAPAQGETGLWLLCSRLADQMDYAPEGAASVYAALVRGTVNSQGVALAYQLLCDKAGFSCQMVQGTLDGSPHWWNLVELDGIWHHVDVTAGLGQEEFLRSDRQMEEQYTWDRDGYPACPETEPPEEDVSIEDTTDETSP